MSELLAVLVDCDSASWDAIESQPPRVAFPDFLSSLLAFLSAFTAMHRRNRLMVLGYSSAAGGYLLLPPPVEEDSGAVCDHMRPAAYTRHLEAALWRLRYGCDPPSSSSASSSSSGSAASPLPPLSPRLSSLTSCLCLALCGLSARMASPASPASTRMLCLHGSADQLGQYIAFNNAARCAHHKGVLIDSLVLSATPSVFLQQAAHQTGGMYLQPAPDMHKGLLQYLHNLLLPPAEHRGLILLPPRTSVNLKAHCLCHRRFCDTAFMCTTCLSLWCQQPPSGNCPACAEAKPSGGGSSSSSSATSAAGTTASAAAAAAQAPPAAEQGPR
jgi:transcription initiation factor TFIIH subunit 3